LSNKAGFYAIKALLGLLMGGFIPYVKLPLNLSRKTKTNLAQHRDIVLWLTYFYVNAFSDWLMSGILTWFVQTSRELTMRLAWFWTALSTVNIVGSLIAAGVLQMRGVAGWGGWRWL
jgi:hypothetical protein